MMSVLKLCCFTFLPQFEELLFGIKYLSNYIVTFKPFSVNLNNVLILFFIWSQYTNIITWHLHIFWMATTDVLGLLVIQHFRVYYITNANIKGQTNTEAFLQWVKKGNKQWSTTTYCMPFLHAYCKSYNNDGIKGAKERAIERWKVRDGI